MSAAPAVATNRWAGAWPDAVAFALGLVVAGWLGWNTTDLVWSLWLASLTVGFAMIIWGAFSPAMLCFREGRTGAGVLAIVSGLAMVAFFAVHFGVFHWAQAAILNTILPLDGSRDFPGLHLLGEAVRRYGWFIPAAALAERQGFQLQVIPPEPPRTSVKAADIAVRKARQGYGWVAVMTPYKNVIRMHLLMIFFGVAHFSKFESFTAYAIVYAVYFFPWRLLRRCSWVSRANGGGGALSPSRAFL
ncbi:MAG: hypothetical protein EXS32_12955 [Opitutus sp.]|nr:hypothetical protein [Opitutus sp.]